MTEEERAALIRQTVRETMEELKREGLLKDAQSAAYSDAIELLRQYYRDGKRDAAITYAIRGLRFDPYYAIIEQYFERRRTNEQIAERMGVELSTIVRNKKRLCLAIYDAIV